MVPHAAVTADVAIYAHTNPHMSQQSHMASQMCYFRRMSDRATRPVYIVGQSGTGWDRVGQGGTVRGTYRIPTQAVTRCPHAALPMSGSADIVARLTDSVQPEGYQELWPAYQQGGVSGQQAICSYAARYPPA